MAKCNRDRDLAQNLMAAGAELEAPHATRRGGNREISILQRLRGAAARVLGPLQTAAPRWGKLRWSAATSQDGATKTGADGRRSTSLPRSITWALRYLCWHWSYQKQPPNGTRDQHYKNATQRGYIRSTWVSRCRSMLTQFHQDSMTQLFQRGYNQARSGSDRRGCGKGG